MIELLSSIFNTTTLQEVCTMFKKLILSVIIASTLSCVMPCVSYADFGNTISLTETGTSSDIIYIKRPESLSASMNSHELKVYYRLL